ncbi:hypothetical protein Tco_1551849 [Tanacetum coccineum]
MKVVQAYDAIPPKDTETPVESPIPVSPSSSVGSSSPVRSTTSPPDYPLISYLSGRGTDNANITRNRPKPDKHEHENG